MNHIFQKNAIKFETRITRHETIRSLSDDHATVIRTTPDDTLTKFRTLSVQYCLSHR